MTNPEAQAQLIKLGALLDRIELANRRLEAVLFEVGALHDRIERTLRHPENVLLEVGTLLDRVELTHRNLETAADYTEGVMWADGLDDARVVALRAALLEIAEQADLGTRICRETLDEFHPRP